MKIYKVDITGVLEESESSSLLDFFPSKAEVEKSYPPVPQTGDLQMLKKYGEEDLDRAIADGVIDDPIESRQRLAQLKPKFEASMIQCLEFENTKAVHNKAVKG